MLYTSLEIEQLKRRRNHLLLAIATLLLVNGISFFFVVGEMFRGSSEAAIRDVMLNPLFLICLAWLGIAIFRLTRAINPRWYFWVPAMAFLLIPFIGILVIPLLLIKASRIIARPNDLPPIGNIPPAEMELAYYRQLEVSANSARLKQNSLR